MALVAKTFHPERIFKLCRIVNAMPIKSHHWYPHYKPGPYPKNKKEWDEAAKKYNLLPEEYEPYPDDGDGLGDYPKLPFESVDSRDPNYHYDNPLLRRDYMDPVHNQMIILFPEFMSTAPRNPSYFKGVMIFFSFVTFALTLFYILNQFKIHQPKCEKQYPFTGEKHYTFELDYELGKLLRKKKECICE